MKRWLFALLLLNSHSPVFSDDKAVTLEERFVPGSEYRVFTKVELEGELTIPVEKDKPPEKVKMSGKSSIEYDERILPTDTKLADHKTLRVYRKIDFARTIGDQKQEMTLRPEVRRLVVMRKQQAKVPFSPDGPLTWGEIDLLRTDIFLPTLAGLLPKEAVKPGDSWKATESATLELTDMEKIEQGELSCKFEEEITLNNRRAAHITLTGDVKGINEDGPTRQKLSGKIYFDLSTKHISYVSIQGQQFLLDKDGKTVTGKIEGGFVMVRELGPRNPDLTEDAMAKTTLEPNSRNSLLLFDNPDMGVRFLYPRNWHIVRTQNGRITIDEKRGGGMLITVESDKRLPTAIEFQRETQAFLKKLEAKTLGTTQPKRIQDSPRELDSFRYDVEIGGERVIMDYLVTSQKNGGATFAARLPHAEQERLLSEVETIAKSFQVTKRIIPK